MPRRQARHDPLGSAKNVHSGTQATFISWPRSSGRRELPWSASTKGAKPYETKYLDARRMRLCRRRCRLRDELIGGHGRRREQLARWVTHPNNKPFARATVNRVWALMFGQPLVEPIDDIPLVGDAYPPGLQLLADDFVAHGYDLRRLIRLIAASEPFSATAGPNSRSPRSTKTPGPRFR